MEFCSQYVSVEKESFVFTHSGLTMKSLASTSGTSIMINDKEGDCWGSFLTIFQSQNALFNALNY